MRLPKLKRRIFMASAAASALRGTEPLFDRELQGQPLTDRPGAPLRLIDPGRCGYKPAKLITSIEFSGEGKGSMACDIGLYYSPTGEIQAGYDTPLDVGGTTKHKIRGGGITDY
jgi:hypothetical protein